MRDVDTVQYGIISLGCAVPARGSVKEGKNKKVRELFELIFENEKRLYVDLTYRVPVSTLVEVVQGSAVSPQTHVTGRDTNPPISPVWFPHLTPHTHSKVKQWVRCRHLCHTDSCRRPFLTARVEHRVPVTWSSLALSSRNRGELWECNTRKTKHEKSKIPECVLDDASLPCSITSHHIEWYCILLYCIVSYRVAVCDSRDSGIGDNWVEWNNLKKKKEKACVCVETGSIFRITR